MTQEVKDIRSYSKDLRVLVFVFKGKCLDNIETWVFNKQKILGSSTRDIRPDGCVRSGVWWENLQHQRAHTALHIDALWTRECLKEAQILINTPYQLVTVMQHGAYVGPALWILVLAWNVCTSGLHTTWSRCLARTGIGTAWTMQVCQQWPQRGMFAGKNDLYSYWYRHNQT